MPIRSHPAVPEISLLWQLQRLCCYSFHVSEALATSMIHSQRPSPKLVSHQQQKVQTAPLRPQTVLPLIVRQGPLGKILHAAPTVTGESWAVWSESRRGVLGVTLYSQVVSEGSNS